MKNSLGPFSFKSTLLWRYFYASHNEPRRRHILRVKRTDRDRTDPDCMTCRLLDDYPDRCGWVSPVFADDGSGVVLNCRGKRCNCRGKRSLD